MLGFRPLADAEAAAVDPSLLPVNERLREYESAWDSHVDVWLVVRVPDPNCVYKCDAQNDHVHALFTFGGVPLPMVCIHVY